MSGNEFFYAQSALKVASRRLIAYGGTMRKQHLLAVLVILFSFTTSLDAQTAAGIIDPSRGIDWTTAGVLGGIPNRTTICASLSPGATAAGINSAIASCPANQVVYLKAGTYSLSDGLVAKANVTLRGAGADLTTLNFTGYNTCGGLRADICVGGPNLYWAGSSTILPGGSHARRWTGGYSRGATQITVDSTSGLSVGTKIILDQANDTADNGQFLACDAINICSLEGGAPGRSINGVTHSQQQYVTITAINGNTLTIAPGLYASNWSGSKDPGIFWTDPITGFGVEDMTLNHLGSAAASGITFTNADSCWAKGVKSLKEVTRNHVWLYLASHVTIQDSYIWGSAPTSQSYGVEFFLSGDILVMNNIFQHCYAGVMSGPTSGSVIAYNFGIDNYDGETTAMSPTFWAGHDAGSTFNLYEGNVSNGMNKDLFHGSTAATTIFRNWFEGKETGKSTRTFPFRFLAMHRYNNIIGNVLGTSGYHTIYESYPGKPSEAQVIYSLGFGSSPVPDDPLVRSYLMRWGNYDVVTASARWDPSEVPSGISPYGNAVPPNNTLPSSFFLSARPTWWTTRWSTPPWPAIGPDVTGGPGPGGHAHAIPAQLCYNNTSSTSGILNFSAANCYSQALRPPILRIVRVP
jgi:hypothetical protein